MALNMILESTSGVNKTAVPDDIAQDLREAYDTLSKLPVNRQISVDFDSSGYDGPAKNAQGNPVSEADKAAYNARKFCRQGKAWATEQEIIRENGTKANLVFSRRGNVKENPARVSFRIYAPRDGEVVAEEAPSK